MIQAMRMLVLCLLAVLLPMTAQAAEEIRSFRSTIEIGADGTLDVVERIRVNVEGREIRRGIFRDFPLRFEDGTGRLREVGFEILSVTRNGAPEPYTTQRGSGMIRVRIGNPDVLIPHGEHLYEIAYRTDRQIRFFEEHDELYWNVTGNGWDFPILEAVADVRLPGRAEARDVTFFTGPLGSREQAASAERFDGGSRIRVSADRSLAPREGLTIAIAMPKGAVAEPSAEQLRAWWLRDNAGLLIAGGGLALVLAYYFWAWLRVGRDPPAGVMVPRWDPPDGISPALANYIDRKGFRGHGWDAFSAAVLNLAVRGLVELDDLDGDMTIRRTEAEAPRDLPVGEATFLKYLGGPGDTLKVNRDSGLRVQAIGSAFRKAIESEHANRFYLHNRGYMFAGVALSVVLLAVTVMFGGFDEESIALMLAMTLPAIVVSIFAVNLGRAFRNARTLGARIAAVVATGFAGFVGLSILSSLAAIFLDVVSYLALPIMVGGVVIANLVFYFLMGAPTPIGRRMMDGIAGLRQYLTFAEKDRMNLQGAPQMSPAHYETLLPYAVALGVEKPWSQAFQNWLVSAAAAKAAAGYVAPSWYRGANLNAGSIGRTMGGLAGSMASSFTFATGAPSVGRRRLAPIGHGPRSGRF
jgi:hypothetical protein